MPSLVSFLVALLCWYEDLLIDLDLERRAGDGDGYGDGIDEREVRAGAFRRPRGSFLRFARRRTEPGTS